MSLLSGVYATLTALAAPWIVRRDARRLAGTGRAGERSGHASLPRPAGDVIWLHAVSVGEAVSVLGLAAVLAPRATVLITTTSANSARIVAERLPRGCLHQYAPLDLPGPVSRFLDHWHPALMVLAESELWPRQIAQAADAGIPVALVNARLSEGALRNWGRARGLAHDMLSRLAMVAAQDARTADGLRALGARNVTVAGTLKSDAAPLEVDAGALTMLRAALGDRPVWVAASTHPGEEAAAAQAHRALLVARPDLLLILVPRHPERGENIAAALPGWRIARRSMGDPLTPQTQILLADTLGELGLWYRLTNAAFLGGSLADRGGHNPLEAVTLGARVVTGPHVANFADIYAGLGDDARRIADADALAPAIAALLERSDAPAPPPPSDLTARLARDLLALMRPGYDARVRVIAPNFKRRLSGVTATILRLVPLQARRIAIRATGPGLPAPIPQAPLRALPLLPYRPTVWHARRNVEMIGGLALRTVLGKPLRLVFTSASQRRHTGLTRWLIARQDAVIATSARSVAYLHRPATIIGHGIDTGAFAPAPDRAALRERLGLPGGVLIGCYGRIRAQKGTDVFVDALLAVLDRHPDATGLVMGRAVDKDAGFLRDLNARIAAAGMRDRLLFCPEVPVGAMAEWYAALDLYVAPQRWEGFGLTPLEAAACGVPSIATRVGAFEEIVLDGTTGLLVPPGDAEALRHAVDALLGDSARRRAMGDDARIRAEGMSLSAEADALEAVYRRVLGLPQK